MKPVDCQDAIAWMARQGTGAAGEPTEDARYAAHCAVCPTCRGRLAAHEAVVEQLAVVLDFTPGPAAEAAFLAAARARGGSYAPPVAPSRPWRRVAAVAAATVLAIAGWWLVDPLGVDPGEGTPRLADLSGDVQILGDPDDDELVAPGAVVVTGAGQATLGEAGDARVVIGSLTRLAVLEWGPHTALELQAGEVRAEVVPRAAGQTFVVHTPNARVIVVGTAFTVRQAPNGATTVIGHEGRVRVETRAGRLVGLVTAGGQVRVAPDLEAGAEGTDAPAPDVVGASSKGRLAAAPGRPPDVARPGRAADPSAEPGGARRPMPTRRPAPPKPASPPAARPVEPTVAGGGPEPAAADEPATDETAAPAEAPRDGIAAARHLLGEGDHAAAIAALEALPPGDWRRDALLGDAWLVAGQMARARQSYARAVDAAERPPAALLADLAAALEADDHDRRAAAAVWRRLLRQHPRSADASTAHLALARAALDADAPARAERHLAAVIESEGPATGRALALLGALLVDERRWADAEALFTRFVDAPEAEWAELAWVGLARVNLGRGRLDAARDAVAAWRARFPSGQRRAEMERIEAALAR